MTATEAAILEWPVDRRCFIHLCPLTLQRPCCSFTARPGAKLVPQPTMANWAGGTALSRHAYRPWQHWHWGGQQRALHRRLITPGRCSHRRRPGKNSGPVPGGSSSARSSAARPLDTGRQQASQPWGAGLEGLL